MNRSLLAVVAFVVLPGTAYAQGRPAPRVPPPWLTAPHTAAHAAPPVVNHTPAPAHAVALPRSMTLSAPPPPSPRPVFNGRGFSTVAPTGRSNGRFWMTRNSFEIELTVRESSLDSRRERLAKNEADLEKVATAARAPGAPKERSVHVGFMTAAINSTRASIEKEAAEIAAFRKDLAEHPDVKYVTQRE